MGNIQEEHAIKKASSKVISFARTYDQNKRVNSNKQKQKQAQKSISQQDIVDSLDLLRNQIINHHNKNEIIQNPNFLHSLIQLYNYKLNIHTDQKNDEQDFKIRNNIKDCLYQIHYFGDEPVQAKLITVGYAAALITSFSTAGGAVEQDDNETWWSLNYFSNFLQDLHLGRNNLLQIPSFEQQFSSFEQQDSSFSSQLPSFISQLPSFIPQPAHFKTCNEQGEEEGGNEEIDSQLYNSDWKGIIKSQAYFANSVILNFYVHMSSQEPDWF